MKSSVVERSTEDALRKALQEIVERHGETLSGRQFANLSSTIRLFIQGFYQDQRGGKVT
jgi:hypothetical protein